MQFRQRLLVSGFIVSFVLVATLTVISFVQTNTLWEQVNRSEHAYQVVNSIDQLNVEMLTSDKAVFHFLALRDSAHYKLFNQSASRFFTEVSALTVLTEDNPEHQQHLFQFRADMTQYFDACRRLFSKPVSTLVSLAETQDFMEMQASHVHARNLLTMMSETEGRILRERTEEREDYLRLTTETMRMLSVIFGILTVLLFTMLLREFGKRLYFQDELQQKIQELLQSKQELEYIAYATSHDLQEPLRKIQILLDKWLLQQKQSNPEHADVAHRVIQSAGHMQQLVGELMMLASLNADATKKSCPIQVYVEAAASQLEEQFLKKQAQLNLGLLPVIQGYPDQLKLLFRCLLDNALKFARPGIQSEIHISCQEVNGDEISKIRAIRTLSFYCVSIQDNGIGFDNKQAENMFGIFRRLHSGREASAEMGAGLAICRRIMTNHRGHIIAHGFPNDGATIKLYFPIPK